MSTPTPQCLYVMYIAMFDSSHTPHPLSRKSQLILCPTQVQVSSLRIQFATCVTNMQDYIASQNTLPLHLPGTIGFTFYFLFEKKPVDIARQALNFILNRERLLASCAFMCKRSGHHFYKALNQQVVFPTVREGVKSLQDRKDMLMTREVFVSFGCIPIYGEKITRFGKQWSAASTFCLYIFSFNVVPHIFSLNEHSNATLFIRNVYCNF